MPVPKHAFSFLRKRHDKKEAFRFGELLLILLLSQEMWEIIMLFKLCVCDYEVINDVLVNEVIALEVVVIMCHL